MSKIYINLPVSDLPKATEFYEKLGFTKNPKFCNDDASWLYWDDNLYLMLLTHNFAKTVLPKHKQIADSHKTCEVFTAIQFDNKEMVDNIYKKAINAWGKESVPVFDYWFMYGHDFEDLDGHIREPFWMNVEDMPS